MRITSSPSSPTTWLAVGVEGGRRRRQARARDLAPVDGLQRLPWTIPVHTSVPPLPLLSSRSWAELLVDPVKALRPAAASRPTPIDRNRDRSNCSPGRSPALRQPIRNAGLSPIIVALRLLGQAPLEAEVGIHRVAVDHHDRRAQQQRGNERVPHHPRGRREPHQPVAAAADPSSGRGSSGARSGSRRGCGRSPSAGPSSPRRTGRTAGGGTGAPRTRAGSDSPSRSSHSIASGSASSRPPR